MLAIRRPDLQHSAYIFTQILKHFHIFFFDTEVEHELTWYLLEMVVEILVVGV